MWSLLWKTLTPFTVLSPVAAVCPVSSDVHHVTSWKPPCWFETCSFVMLTWAKYGPSWSDPRLPQREIKWSPKNQKPHGLHLVLALRVSLTWKLPSYNIRPFQCYIGWSIFMGKLSICCNKKAQFVSHRRPPWWWVVRLVWWEHRTFLETWVSILHYNLRYICTSSVFVP